MMHGNDNMVHGKYLDIFQFRIIYTSNFTYLFLRNNLNFMQYIFLSIAALMNMSIYLVYTEFGIVPSYLSPLALICPLSILTDFFMFF